MQENEFYATKLPKGSEVIPGLSALLRQSFRLAGCKADSAMDLRTLLCEIKENLIRLNIFFCLTLFDNYVNIFLVCDCSHIITIIQLTEYKVFVPLLGNSLRSYPHALIF